ncbi:MAG: bis(5'-nucleosyl)-tetraphosphatase (symmetrical) YqeK [Erysipelotrichaceae bacterium]|nr:bis(5'-nucleosyl)-tetraphosphatase (symmetrical) YqeK [Erysipelotrichaceae bacterium]
MIRKDITFDNFMTLDADSRKELLKDREFMKQLVKKNMKKSRYLHSLSVADTCEMLAECHGVDPDKAYMAGLLHDVCKFPDEKTSGVLEEYLKKYDPEKLNSIQGGYHGWVAKYYLIEKCDYKDEEILNAIYNHTICNSDDKLSLILYIADKREPLRKIDDDILEIAKYDLYRAYEMLKDDVEQYVRGKNEGFVKNSV